MDTLPSRWLKQRRPDLTVVRGGPHVTALREAIEGDVRYGRWVDRFWSGLRARVGHNRFALERRSPMEIDPWRFGLEVVARWPRETVVEWAPLSTGRHDRRVASAARSTSRSSSNPMMLSRSPSPSSSSAK